jgi:hypothetical protein
VPWHSRRGNCSHTGRSSGKEIVRATAGGACRVGGLGGAGASWHAATRSPHTRMLDLILPVCRTARFLTTRRSVVGDLRPAYEILADVCEPLRTCRQPRGRRRRQASSTCESDAPRPDAFRSAIARSAGQGPRKRRVSACPWCARARWHSAAFRTLRIALKRALLLFARDVQTGYKLRRLIRGLRFSQVIACASVLTGRTLEVRWIVAKPNAISAHAF